MNTERDALLKQITILDFTAVDLQLYLNTHPTDADALHMYNDCVESSRQARQRYEQQFGPITGFRSENMGCWAWMESPWPWQADFNFSLNETRGGSRHVGV